MSMNARELFSDMGATKTSESGRYIIEGRYHLVVTELKCFESTRDAGKYYFCADFRVEDSSVSTYGKGDKISWLVKMGTDTANMNIKELMKALIENAGDGDIDAETMEHVLSPDQPCADTVVYCNAYDQEMRTKPGQFFTRCRWLTDPIQIKTDGQPE